MIPEEVASTTVDGVRNGWDEAAVLPHLPLALGQVDGPLARRIRTPLDGLVGLHEAVQVKL